MANLADRKIAILATDGFEEDELLAPRDHFRGKGAEVHVVSPKDGRITAWRFTDWSDPVDVDVTLDAARPQDYDALVLPGGQINPDKLRLDEQAVDFVRAFVNSGKPVAAICHGPWLLVEAGAVKGLQMTSFPSIKTDCVNAGADWVDRQVVNDRGIITSRKPDDLPAFNAEVEKAVLSGETHARNAA